MAKKREGTDLDRVARLAEQAKLDGDPSSFLSGALIYSDFAIVLGGCVEFNSEIPEIEQKRIITKIAHDSSISRPITATSLLLECTNHEKEYLKLPKKSFRLLTEVSVSWTIDIPKIIIGGTYLTFAPKSNLGFTSRSKLFQESATGLGFKLPNNYMKLVANVRARTAYEATEIALNSIDLVRASWNLAINRGKKWRYSGGIPSPINEIRLSPFHTIHDTKGKLALDTFWYDPGYSKPAYIFSDKAKFSDLISFASKLRSKIAKLPYRSDIEGALVRYVRALDSADLNDTFLRLWSILEYLTDSPASYKQATRRAAFMFADRERSLLVLTNLTNHRNRFVHAGSEADDIESLVFQLMRYVNALLTFHIGNSFKFATRSEAALFMDNPTNKKELEARIKRLNNVRKFINT